MTALSRTTDRNIARNLNCTIDYLTAGSAACYDACSELTPTSCRRLRY